MYADEGTYAIVDKGTTATITNLRDQTMFESFDEKARANIAGFNGAMSRSKGSGTIAGFTSEVPPIEKYVDRAPSRGHEASEQSGLGVGCKLCSSSTGSFVGWVYVRRRGAYALSPFLCPPRSAMGRGAWKCNTGS